MLALTSCHRDTGDFNIGAVYNRERRAKDKQGVNKHAIFVQTHMPAGSAELSP